MTKSLNKFTEAQNQMYLAALAEIMQGQKKTHWMWFVFPQLRGLGRSDTARFYGITDRAEAIAYIEHPVLGKHLIEISKTLLRHSSKTAREIMGRPDDVKLRSSMTLFSTLPDAHPVFDQVLATFFHGEKDDLTLKMLADQE